MSVTAVYDRTIYYNEQNKYCVICVKTNDQSVPKEARGRSQGDRQIRFTAVGYELPRTDKVSMVLEGEWQSGKYGLQLKVSSFEEIVPQTRDGVQGYLASRLVKGVGAKTAALIVDRFGADALHILENEPERLLEIKGITVNKLEDNDLKECAAELPADFTERNEIVQYMNVGIDVLALVDIKNADDSVAGLLSQIGVDERYEVDLPKSVDMKRIFVYVGLNDEIIDNGFHEAVPHRVAVIQQVFQYLHD